MAADRETRPDGVEPLGRIVIVIDSETLRPSLKVEGIYNDPFFIAAAIDYLQQYQRRRWDEVWDTGRRQGEE